MPVAQLSLSEADFDALPGFELRPTAATEPGAFLVGFNRFANGAAILGRLEMVSNPIRPVGLLQ